MLRWVLSNGASAMLDRLVDALEGGMDHLLLYDGHQERGTCRGGAWTGRHARDRIGLPWPFQSLSVVTASPSRSMPM